MSSPVPLTIMAVMGGGEIAVGSTFSFLIGGGSTIATSADHITIAAAVSLV